MKNINGTQYISVKEYAEMKNLTPGRIYQLKNELPFEKFDDLGVELINFDLLQLSEKENSLAMAKFQTSQALHTYDYKQLGLLVADMFKTSNEVRTNSETLLREKDAVLLEKLALIEELLESNKKIGLELADAQTLILEKDTALAQKDMSLSEISLTMISLKETIEEKEALILEQNNQIADLEAIEEKITKNYEAKPYSYHCYYYPPKQNLRYFFFE
jgi:hypothetical protein